MWLNFTFIKIVLESLIVKMEVMIVSIIGGTCNHYLDGSRGVASVRLEAQRFALNCSSKCVIIALS